MSVSELVAEELNSKYGYAYENDDTSATFKVIAQNKLWLYFGKTDENGGPYFGYWAEDTVSDAARKALITALAGWMFDENSGKVTEEGPLIYREWKLTSEAGEATIAKMIIDTLKDLELQTHKILSENKFLTVLSQIFFGSLTFFLSIFGYILWFALKKHYPKQAKSCLIGSTAGSAMMILTIGLAFLLPDNAKDNTEGKKVLTAEEEKETEERFALIFAVAVVIGIIILLVWRSRPQCPECGKRSLVVIDIIALDDASDSYKTVKRRDVYRNKDGNITGYRDRNEQIHVMEQPIRTTYQCTKCGCECESDSVRTWEG